MNILVAGMGFAGRAIAAALARDGHGVWGLNRLGTDAPEGARAVAGDVLLPETLRGLSPLPPMDLLVSALSGTGHKDPELYRRVYVEGPARVADALTWSSRRCIWFLGSTGVYGAEDGEWVDENTPANPRHRAGEVQLAAEAALRDAADAHCVLRLSGLYGPGRTRLIRQALRKRPYFKPDIWANQIHRDDVAGVVAALARREARAPELLLVSDDRPAPRREIFDWVRRETGCPEGLYDEDHPARAGRNRGNKRVSNRKLRELDLPLRYPDYARGLRELLPWVSTHGPK